MNNDLIVFEGITSISALIRAYEKSENHRKITKIWFDVDKQRQKSHQLSFLRAKSKELGFLLEGVSNDQINSVATGNTHGGFAAFCTDRVYAPLSHEKITDNGIYYLIDGVEDPYNFGYTLRALYASGADGVILPQRNWLSAAGVVCRSSAGCSELIDIYTAEDIESAVKTFKDFGYRILTANIRDSESLYEADLSSPVLFVIGGEKRGISGKILSLSDLNIRIGYGREFNGSLPTAQAAAVIAFEVAKSNNRIK